MSSRTLLRGSFYLLVFCLPFAKAIIELSFVVMLAAWLRQLWLRRQRQEPVWRLPRFQTWPLAVYLGFCVLSILTSTNPAESLRAFFSKTLEYLAFFVMTADLARDVGVVRRAVAIFCWSAAIVAIDGWLQEWTGVDWILGHTLAEFGYGRMIGPYESPNDLATYFMVMLPLALVAWRTASHARGRWLAGVLVVLLFVSFIRTDSQGAWLGLAAGAVILLLWLREARPLLLGGLGAAGVAAVGLLWLKQRIPSWQELFGAGPADRLFMWRAAWGMVRDHPWTGVGLNTFMANYLDYWVGGERMPRYAHNCFLQTAAEIGLPGLAAFVWVLVALVAVWWRRAAAMCDRADRVLLYGLLSAAVAFLVQSFFDTNFYALRQVTLFWVVAGLATGLSQPVAARSPATDELALASVVPT